MTFFPGVLVFFAESKWFAPPTPRSLQRGAAI